MRPADDAARSTPTVGRDASPGALPCRYPEGTCDFDADCPAGQRCDGALHTTGVPHAFVCQGVCVPADTDVRPACAPPAEAVQVELSLEPGEQAQFLVLQTNVGCAPLYQWRSCCGVSPLLALQVSDADGGWMLASCNAIPEPCLPCTAEPTCEPVLAPGATVRLRRPAAECSCPGGVVRAAAALYTDSACTDLAEYFSNELLLGCAAGAP